MLLTKWAMNSQGTDDPLLRACPTNLDAGTFHTTPMDEPNFPSEHLFWEQVTDWLMGDHTSGGGLVTPAEIEALLRDTDAGPSH